MLYLENLLFDSAKLICFYQTRDLRISKILIIFHTDLQFAKYPV